MPSRVRFARPVVAALVVAFASTLSAGPARAQDDATTRAARSRFQEGVAFFDKGQFENARAAFLQAYALKKHPAVLLNLAQSSLRSNHPLEAARFFQQFLREAQGITVAQRETANAGLADARVRLGRLDVVAPSGSEVTVDAERAGTAPLADTVDVDPGAHTIAVRLPDGKDETQTVSVGAGQRTTARFGASSATAAPVAGIPVVPAPAAVTPAAPPPAAVTSAPAPSPPAVEGAPTTVATAEALPSKGLFSPPKTMAPVWIGVALGLAGTIDAIAFAVAKGKAQENADDVEATIRAADRPERAGRGVCASQDPADVQRFSQACGVLADNRKTVDTDATLANVGIVVGGVGFATALGWYLFAAKDDAPSTTGLRFAPPRATFGRGGGGITLGGSF